MVDMRRSNQRKKDVEEAANGRQQMQRAMFGSAATSSSGAGSSTDDVNEAAVPPGSAEAVRSAAKDCAEDGHAGVFAGAATAGLEQARLNARRVPSYARQASPCPFLAGAIRCGSAARDQCV